MADIIKCSGGEAFDFTLPLFPGQKIVLVSCKEDLDLCRECINAGIPVHSAELILGGVLRQLLDFTLYICLTGDWGQGARVV